MCYFCIDNHTLYPQLYYPVFHPSIIYFSTVTLISHTTPIHPRMRVMFSLHTQTITQLNLLQSKLLICFVVSRDIFVSFTFFSFNYIEFKINHLVPRPNLRPYHFNLVFADVFSNPYFTVYQPTLLNQDLQFYYRFYQRLICSIQIIPCTLLFFLSLSFIRTSVIAVYVFNIVNMI